MRAADYGSYQCMEALCSTLLGLPLPVVEEYLQEQGLPYSLELTYPTRALGTPGEWRVINCRVGGRGTIELTCAREFI